ncbi:MetQ/NlpA family ABC transporter substrate-binding protein [Leucobacter sp. UT-8R-CII-1-4]|uniref:MetQ/NlpA family ABC transporter substrate-binding protein n=1 Tax=Leucobacter sp. UT-8R-CII-1-4 TaxID=3040075 RepID=UPI0024A9A250|nr:MetQ/NlpA family ABC transporter substrate-binding protein [Leucobacter sp. UT-8R-CII-1-4]MDI6023664.1 MetQ/NlpA family ABC transporter substrate-binding protein [Leucobacter sp. UT-8R-CII-1-4]
MSTERPARPEKPKSRLGLWIGIAVAAVIAIVAAIVTPALLNANSAGNNGENGASVETVKLGVNDIAAGHWEVLVDLAKEEGIDVELVSFTDYNTPNPALDAGDVDINKFQHLRFLAQYNATQGGDLVPLASTEIFPIGFFSKKWTSVEEIPAGAEVTLSNNPANQVRPLLALYNAGLIEFTKPADWSVTIDDVDYSKSKLGKITPIDPTQTAASLDSVDIAFVDTPYQLAAGLGEKEQIYVEDADRDDLQQYVNVFAVRAENADNPALKKVAELYHHPDVIAAIQAESGYQGVFKQLDEKTLKSVLAEQEKEFAQQ